MLEEHFRCLRNTKPPPDYLGRELVVPTFSLTTKIMNSKRVECVIISFELVQTLGLDGVYPILLEKGAYIGLGRFTKLLRANVVLRTVSNI